MIRITNVKAVFSPRRHLWRPLGEQFSYLYFPETKQQGMRNLEADLGLADPFFRTSLLVLSSDSFPNPFFLKDDPDMLPYWGPGISPWGLSLLSHLPPGVL